MVNLLAITIPVTVYIAVDCCKGRGHYIRITLLQAQETYLRSSLEAATLTNQALPIILVRVVVTSGDLDLNCCKERARGR